MICKIKKIWNCSQSLTNSRIELDTGILDVSSSAAVAAAAPFPKRASHVQRTGCVMLSAVLSRGAALVPEVASHVAEC